MDRPVMVVGATGNVGSAVAESLMQAGVPVRLTGTDLERLATRYPSAHVCRLDLRNPLSFPAAVEGAGSLFLLRPPPIARVGPTLNALVDAAREAGVRHVVFSSVAGADTNRVVPHHRVEAHLRNSGIAWTILRPGFFAQNLADAYHRDILEDDRIYVPAAGGRVAFVDTRDIGDAAANVLTNPTVHAGRGYTLTGPTAVTFDEVAEVLTDALGRPIRYAAASVPGYVLHLRRQGLPVPQILVQTVLHAGLRRGDAEHIDPALRQLLGRQPRTVADYIRDHPATWTRP